MLKYVFCRDIGLKMSLNDVLALRRQAGGVIGKFQARQTTLHEVLFFHELSFNTVTLGMHTVMQ